MRNVFYILEDDLLKHLPFCDGAVNLTTTMEPWKMGLSKAYAESFPKVYENYTEAQEAFKVEKSIPWVDREDDKSPYVICLPMKTTRLDKQTPEELKEALTNLKDICHDHELKDVIMPIVITGDLKESIETLREHLSNDHTRFWVGISTSRAEAEELPEDDDRVYVGSSVSLSPDFIQIALKDLIKEGSVLFKWKDMENDRRIGHWCTKGIAFIKEDKPDLKFNEHINRLKDNGLDVEFVPVETDE